MSSRIFEWLMELLFPTRAVCLGCGDEHGCDEPFLCADCRKLLKAENVAVERTEWRKHGLDRVSFVYYYGKPVKGLIHAFKFRGVRMLAESMAHDLDSLIEQRHPAEQYDLIVPVPLHPSRLYQRGYNQAEVLAVPLGVLRGIEVRTDVLYRIRKTRQQAKLHRSKRSRNTLAAFRATDGAAGKRVLLIDDVVTTGSTLCACSDALKAAGAQEIHAITLAGSRACYTGKVKRYRLRKK